jgi:hypothetical protein
VASPSRFIIVCFRGLHRSRNSHVFSLVFGFLATHAVRDFSYFVIPCFSCGCREQRVQMINFGVPQSLNHKSWVGSELKP